jgi:dihydroorotase
MKKTLIKNAKIINEGIINEGDLLIVGDRIEKIASSISENGAKILDVEGQYLMPGIIDDQVHFREPGLTHKATIYTESKAAVAGGVTSFMEMPNTKPPAFTIDRLEEKYKIAQQSSLANYSFFMGTSNDNLEEIKKVNPEKICGVKIFMGSSTGNLLVDDEKVLERIFSEIPFLIATHCEDEQTILRNLELAKIQFGDQIPFEQHPIIRNEEACYLSSSYAIGLAKKHQTRLHVLHISTGKELELFSNEIPLEQKRITSEVCVHHLSFNETDYARLGSLIKCNPAIKSKEDQDALLEGLLDDRLDIIATDHAPHTWEEKQNLYLNAPSGLPLIQHPLNMMLSFYHRQKISLEKIVEKMCHAPATCFRIKERGFLREGYFADLAVVDLDKKWVVNKENLYYKCGWSPLEGQSLQGKVTHTIINGHLAYEKGIFDESMTGQRLLFNASNS